MIRRRRPVVCLALTGTVLLHAGCQKSGAPRAASAPAASLTASTRDSVIDGVMQAMERDYVFPEVALRIGRKIGDHRARGKYAAITVPESLASALTIDLREASHDKHVLVHVGVDPHSVAPPLSATDDAGCSPTSGLCRDTIFPGNIGYLGIRSFFGPVANVRGDLARAMTRLARCDALILDVRRNGGGSPYVVQLVASYLFPPEPLLLMTLYFRPTNQTDRFYTLRRLDGPRFPAPRPVYILTSGRTFSAAEAFAYHLQNRRRAIVVGDTTAGGAHAGSVHSLAGSFTVFVPDTRAIDPITKTDWETVGVRPDIAVPADSALAVALREARRRR